MIYLIKYVFEIKQKNPINSQSTYHHANINVDLVEQNIIQVNGGIMINVNMSIRKCHV